MEPFQTTGQPSWRKGAEVGAGAGAGAEKRLLGLEEGGGEVVEEEVVVAAKRIFFCPCPQISWLFYLLWTMKAAVEEAEAVEAAEERSE